MILLQTSWLLHVKSTCLPTSASILRRLLVDVEEHTLLALHDTVQIHGIQLHPP